MSGPLHNALQKTLKFGTRPIQTRRRGADWNSQNGRNLLVVQPFAVSEKKYRPQWRIEALQRVLEHFRLFETAARRGLLRNGLKSQRVWNGASGAAIAQAFVDRYSVKPGGKACGPPETAQSGEDPKKNFLSHVVGLARTHQANRKAVNLPTEVLVELSLGKSIPVPAA